MKPYGVPRVPELEGPDLADIANFGLKAGRLHPKWTANGDSKRRARRVWKKKERQKIKNDLHKYLDR